MVAAPKKVVLGDGAEWIWNIAAQHFPRAIQIVDLFHARQPLWDLARKLYPNQEAGQIRWMTIHQDMLDEGRIEELVATLRSICSSNPELTDKIRKEAAYFEACCKTVIGSRRKQSGMFWTVRGANAIIALRLWHINGQFEDYRESGAA